MFKRQLMIAAHSRERGEDAGKIRPGVVATHGVYDALEHLRSSSGFWRDSLAGNEACDEHLVACRSEKVDNLGSDAHLCCYSSAGAFAPPVDAKQVRSLAPDTQDEGFAGDIHAVILVSDAAEQRRDYSISAAPPGYLAQNALNLLIHEISLLLYVEDTSRLSFTSSERFTIPSQEHAREHGK